jgi:hypothetical protein
MNTKNTKILAIAASMAAILASAPAEAQHRRHFGGPRISFGIGLGLGAPYYPYYRPHYYYAPYPYYYPPVVVRPAPPPVYIERPDNFEERYEVQPQAQYQAPPPVQSQPTAAQDHWFYCPDSQTYYPYVQQCAVEWQRVIPRPPSN